MNHKRKDIHPAQDTCPYFVLLSVLRRRMRIEVVPQQGGKHPAYIFLHPNKFPIPDSFRCWGCPVHQLDGVFSAMSGHLAEGIENPGVIGPPRPAVELLPIVG